MSSRDHDNEIETPAEAQGAAKPSTRRSLLRRAALSVPLIATVPSGAALARSSNLISGATEAGAQDAFGRTRCLDLDSVRRYGSDGHVDLGDPAHGEVALIPDRDYRVQADPRSRRIRESEMCERGGKYYYRRRGLGYGADDDGGAPGALGRDSGGSQQASSSDDFGSAGSGRGRTGGGRPQQWEAVDVPRGMLVSATALSSFAGAIRYKDI